MVEICSGFTLIAPPILANPRSNKLSAHIQVPYVQVTLDKWVAIRELELLFLTLLKANAWAGLLTQKFCPGVCLQLGIIELLC